MMKADAIIFDKDGTLLDFDAFWVTVSVKAIEAVLAEYHRENVPVGEILEAFGVRDGVTDMNSVLCKGTYEQLGQITYEILARYGCGASCEAVTQSLIDGYNRNADAGDVRPTCSNLAQVLADLKAKGIKLAVVTTDNMQITRTCLEKLGIADFFDRIYTDDGEVPTKPDPFCVYHFCEFAGVEKERVIMVGDTMTDMRFAKNAGISAIGIAKNDLNKQVLAPHAAAVLPDPSGIVDLLNC
jgi:phosphoglycolate phosphatase